MLREISRHRLVVGIGLLSAILAILAVDAAPAVAASTNSWTRAASMGTALSSWAAVTPWTRDLDLVVPLWQGADDDRVTPGPLALAELIEPGPARRLVPIPNEAGHTDGGVRHLDVLVAARRAVRACLADRSPARVLAFGSDCAVEVATISYLAERHGALAVAWFDAHADLNTPDSSPSGAAHGMALRLLLGEGHPALLPAPAGRLDPAAVVLAGVRDLDSGEARYMADRGLVRVAAEDMERDPALVRRALPPGRPVYVHLDVDAIDPLELPATGWPAAAGLGLEAAERVLDDLMRHREVVGVGIMEFVPTIAHEPGALRRLLAALGLRGPG